MGLCSIPFAFTEWMFYPSYWQPKFLWNLADKIGFGIEDLIFVTGLGGLTATIYPFSFAKKLMSEDKTHLKATIIRLFFVFLITALLVFLIFILKIPMIYGAVAIMLLTSFFIILKRKDLFLPSLLGGILTCFIYIVICLIFSLIFKEAFKNVWHGDKFSGVYIAGILLEEYLYGFSAGVAGSLFY
ncbi:MAG: lycopene cyclase domain-containing protein, partial [Chitinispirillaceae bacterium]|nr:lycopene cyclase domain-containing protein [Chitinispirillaceae bacterium]